MIKIAVVDDNIYFFKQFKGAVESCFNEEKNIDYFDDSLKFSADPQKYLYDIVFLDIDMPEVNGFQLAENLKMINNDIVIVFVSNYENYIHSSFEFEPMCFIRKNYLSQDMDFFRKIYRKKFKKSDELFFLQTKDLEKNIPLDSVAYFENMGHDLFVKTSTEKYKIKRSRNNELTLTKLTERLTKKGFIRVHRSFLVNHKYIYLIQKNDILLKNEEIIPINFRKADEIKQIYQKLVIGEE